MLSDHRIIGFIPTTDPVRARKFFEDACGLEFVSDDNFALVFRCGGSRGNMIRVVRVKEYTPMLFTILGWEVANLEREVRSLRSRGVLFERYSFLEQDDDLIWTAPDGATKVAWFKDPDGNILSLSQHAEHAASA
jgi:catechol 2,3-dioxygenase-like lactoylglutathione lyase family enzyme